MYLLDIEPIDLGQDIRAVNLELVEDEEQREPVRGEDAAAVWAAVLPAIAGGEPWGFDFFSHLDRVRDYCERHGVAFREGSQRSIVVPTPSAEELEPLLARFQGETFGVRAGGLIVEGDPALEGDLARRGADAYHGAYSKYYFCAVCDFENGSLVVLSQKLWASEVIRRVRPILKSLDSVEVNVHLPS